MPSGTDVGAIISAQRVRSLIRQSAYRCRRRRSAFVAIAAADRVVPAAAVDEVIASQAMDDVRLAARNQVGAIGSQDRDIQAVARERVITCQRNAAACRSRDHDAPIAILYGYRVGRIVRGRAEIRSQQAVAAESGIQGPVGVESRDGKLVVLSFLGT